MSTLYGIYVMHVGDEDSVAELAGAVKAELEAIGLHRSVAVDVGDEPFPDDVPSVGVFLGNAAAARDPTTLKRIDAALDSGTVVIPVVLNLARFSVEVPPRLAVLNGFAWNASEGSVRLARLLLEQLGIEDRQRGVFISHKREDGLGAAEQIHDRLTHQGFVPFIDRFAIRAGERVQSTIADALESHAFMLMLETPEAHGSPWVFDEVDYALSHYMGILIVSWPEDPLPVPGSIGLPRHTLAADDVIRDPHGYEVLTDSAINRLVAAVEAAHARGIVRRRRMLTRSVEEAAFAAGATAVPQRAWQLLIEQAGKSTLVGITPRLPTAEDLQRLDEARSEVDAEAEAVLVHSARVLRPSLKQHLVWVAGTRDLVLTPENAVGGTWT